MVVQNLKSRLASRPGRVRRKFYPDQREKRDFVFFLHIPKTAGTSVTRLLEKSFDGDVILRPEALNRVSAESRERLARVQLMYGHFPREVYKTRLPRMPTFALTFLRDPVAHYVSTFFHLKADPTFTFTIRLSRDESLAHEIHQFVKDATLEEFLDFEHSRLFDNFQTRYLIRGLSDDPLPDSDEACLATAKRLLLDLPFFGITERMQESISLMSDVLALGKALSPKHVNHSKHKPADFEVGKDALAEINHRMHIDRQLYDFAIEQFSHRLQLHVPQKGRLIGVGKRFSSRKANVRAVIHMGMEKTGSTALQEFFHLNRALLARNGVAYAAAPGIRNHRGLASYCLDIDRPDDHLTQLGLRSVEEREKWRAEFRKLVTAEQGALPGDAQVLVYSNEHLQSRLQSEENIARLKELLSPSINEVEILIYLRRQDLVATSRHSTALKAGRLPDSIIPVNCRPNNGFFNYLNTVRRWERVFGRDKLKIRVFEKAQLKEGDLILDFMESSGIEPSDRFLYPARENESLAREVQEAVMMLNRVLSKEKFSGRRGMYLRQLRRDVIRDLARANPGLPQLPSRSEARAFYQIFEESNMQLAREYLGRDTLFDDDFSNYPEVVEEVALDQAMVEDLFEVLLARIQAPWP